jgi:hypothetical protein
VVRRPAPVAMHATRRCNRNHCVRDTGNGWERRLGNGMALPAGAVSDSIPSLGTTVQYPPPPEAQRNRGRRRPPPVHREGNPGKGRAAGPSSRLIDAATVFVLLRPSVLRGSPALFEVPSSGSLEELQFLIIFRVMSWRGGCNSGCEPLVVWAHGRE